MRNCPYCDEKIEQDAFFCPHCSRETALESTPQPDPAPDPLPDPASVGPEPLEPPIDTAPDRKNALFIIGLVAIPIMLCALCTFCGVALTILSTIGEMTAGSGY